MAAQEDSSGVRKSGSESAAAAAARVVAAANNSTQQQQRRSSSAASRVSRPSPLKNASGSGSSSVAITSALPPRVPPLINDDDDDDDEEAAFAGFPALEVELARSGEMIAAAIDNVARFVHEHDVIEFINNELDRESATVALLDAVTAIVCLGFPFNTADGKRGSPDDVLLDACCPIMFVIGQHAMLPVATKKTKTSPSKQLQPPQAQAESGANLSKNLIPNILDLPIIIAKDGTDSVPTDLPPTSTTTTIPSLVYLNEGTPSQQPIGVKYTKIILAKCTDQSNSSGPVILTKTNKATPKPTVSKTTNTKIVKVKSNVKKV
ncbi:unnamed protein product [Trichogramma brassicae]|uniref:Uncharacterized protein n=1 Tax=Trichogramma brassicae TaxID=86971 RepID=A0A6H5I1L1_9HYME|nr:unnamed protein product [Trichogramma brassicae]